MSRYAANAVEIISLTFGRARIVVVNRIVRNALDDGW